jgi:methylamine dehydrogenase accessory protein MauD
MSSLWVASQLGLWAFCVVLTLLVLGLYRQVGELMISSSRRFPLSEGLQIGSEAHAFKLLDQWGQPIGVPLNGDKSLPTILIFGSPECPPCGKLAGALGGLVDELGRIVFVSGPDAEGNRRFAEAHEASYPILTQDAGLSVSQLYKVERTPLVYVVDSENVIRSKGIANDAEAVRALVAEADRQAKPTGRAR